MFNNTAYTNFRTAQNTFQFQVTLFVGFNRTKMTQTKHSLVIWLKQEKILNFWNWALKIIFYFTKSWLARNIVGSPKANVCDRNSLILFRVRFLRAARGWENSCFKFSNLGLTLGLALKFYTSVVRWLKLKVKNVFEIYSNFCRSYRGKTGREPLAGLIPCYWSFLNSMLRAILCADGVYICKSWHNKIKKTRSFVMQKLKNYQLNDLQENYRQRI